MSPRARVTAPDRCPAPPSLPACRAACSMLKKDPVARPSVEQLLCCSFLQPALERARARAQELMPEVQLPPVGTLWHLTASKPGGGGAGGTPSTTTPVTSKASVAPPASATPCSSTISEQQASPLAKFPDLQQMGTPGSTTPTLYKPPAAASAQAGAAAGGTPSSAVMPVDSPPAAAVLPPGQAQTPPAPAASSKAKRSSAAVAAAAATATTPSSSSSASRPVRPGVEPGQAAATAAAAAEPVFAAPAARRRVVSARRTDPGDLPASGPAPMGLLKGGPRRRALSASGKEPEPAGAAAAESSLQHAALALGCLPEGAGVEAGGRDGVADCSTGKPAGQRAVRVPTSKAIVKASWHNAMAPTPAAPTQSSNSRAGATAAASQSVDMSSSALPSSTGPPISATSVRKLRQTISSKEGARRVARGVAADGPVKPAWPAPGGGGAKGGGSKRGVLLGGAVSSSKAERDTVAKKKLKPQPQADVDRRPPGTASSAALAAGQGLDGGGGRDGVTVSSSGQTLHEGLLMSGQDDVCAAADAAAATASDPWLARPSDNGVLACSPQMCRRTQDSMSDTSSLARVSQGGRCVGRGTGGQGGGARACVVQGGCLGDSPVHRGMERTVRPSTVRCIQCEAADAYH